MLVGGVRKQNGAEGGLCSRAPSGSKRRKRPEAGDTANSLAVRCRGGGKRAVRKEQTAAGTRHVAGRT